MPQAPHLPEEYRKLSETLVPLNDETGGGGLNEVYYIDFDKLLEKFEVGQDDLSDPLTREKINLLLDLVVKPARLEYFVQHLWSEKMLSYVSKERMAATFGPIGNEIVSSPRKAKLDAKEAAQLIPILGKGPKYSIDVFRTIKEIRSKISSVTDLTTDRFLTFYNGREYSLIELLSKNKWLKKMIREMKARKVLSEKDLPKNSIDNESDLEFFQTALRHEPLTPEMEMNFKKFFEASRSYGTRAILRKLKHWHHHPICGFEKAKKVILGCFEEFGEEDFLLKENNYYGLAKECSEDEFKEIFETNERVVQLFTNRLLEKIPANIFHRPEIESLWRAILSYYHDFPRYEVEKNMSLLSCAMLKTLFRFFYHFIGHIMGAVYHPKPNNDFEMTVKDDKRAVTNEKIFPIVMELMKEYSGNLGIYDGEDLLSYERFPTVNYTFQERAGTIKTGETLIARLSLADLRNERNWHFFEEFPDLAKKLLVFAVLVYRYFSDTGYLIDLRPEKQVMSKLLFLGVYGYETDNVMILLKKNQKGAKEVVIKLIDNKDQFKKVITPYDVMNPPGLAKTAFDLADDIGGSALLRFIGKLVQIVLHNEGER